MEQLNVILAISIITWQDDKGFNSILPIVSFWPISQQLVYLRTPPPNTGNDIRLASGRYVSYQNAFLFYSDDRKIKYIFLNSIILRTFYLEQSVLRGIKNFLYQKFWLTISLLKKLRKSIYIVLLTRTKTQQEILVRMISRKSLIGELVREIWPWHNVVYGQRSSHREKW